MITYLVIFALGAVLGALAMLCVIISVAPDEEPFMTPEEIMTLRKAIEADEIRRRYESECG